MSIETLQENCQTILAEIVKTLQPYEERLASELQLDSKPLSLQLSSEQLALLVAHWQVASLSKFVVAEWDADSPRKFFSLLCSLNSFAGVDHQWHFLSDQLTEQEQAGDVITDLSLAYHALLYTAGEQHHFVASPAAVRQPLPDPIAYQYSCLSLSVSEKISLRDITARLIAMGYTRQQTSLSAGTFRVRGESIDVNHPYLAGHFTILFFGNTIEQIVHQQDRRSTSIHSVILPPMKFPTAAASWSDVLTSRLLFRPEHIEIAGRHTIITNAAKTHLPFGLTSSEVGEHAPSRLFLIYANRDRIEQYALDNPQQPAVICQHPLAEVALQLASKEWMLLTEHHIFPPQTRTASPVSYERALELIGQLEVGRPAVHADHGIGIYEGLQRRVINTLEKEYLVIRYAAGDALYVPAEFAHKVTAYVGQKQPPIHRLGGTLWQKTKKRAQADASVLARELLAIAGKRHTVTRTPYTISPRGEAGLAASFPHELTPDQEQTWQDVQEDMRSEIPMDRLVVGDVGFGKTEIALRAAYHAIRSGKQVAVLAPTTLLVQQHFDTFQQRLSADLQDHIFMLSRFISPKEQRVTRQATDSGTAQIVIGTHALLSKSTRWKNLGLVIIDEEQRFGVKQKEHFKTIRTQLDVLSLSATPIPRTLSMALSGLRSLSIINTPPKKRKSVRTYVKKVDDEDLKAAIRQELARGGQIYVVAPKIRHLPSIQEHIHALFPKASIAIAHGQLPDPVLSRIIHDFDAGSIDILVSSSIVENGLDLPNVNTMIVWHAPFFGLAELYQLRGRIGRRERQGYAYFLYNQERLTEVQRERLTAITEASRLGAGWHIARRDLEMRGAGNLLGAEQSGSVESVGVSLYLDMIQRAASDEWVAGPQVDIELPLPAALPTHYIRSERERTRWYNRLSRAKNEQALTQHRQALEQQYGDLPPEGKHLLLLIELQYVASRLGITKISSAVIAPPDEEPYARLQIEGENLPRTLAALQTLGKWRVRQNALTFDLEAVSPAFIQKLVTSLNQQA